MKKIEKMKKWKKKKRKNVEKWWKKKEKWKKLDSHAKSSTISMILFRNVSLSRGKSTTRFGG